MTADQKAVDGNLGPPSGYAAALLEVLAFSPARIVVIRRGVAITAAELLVQIGLAADSIANIIPPTMGKNPRIGLMFHDNMQAIVHGIGCWLSGAEPHFLDHRLAPASLPALMARDQMKLVLTGRGQIDPTLGDVIAATQNDMRPDALARAAQRIADARHKPPAPHSPAMIAASSGVSGPPKLISRTQRQMFKTVLAEARSGWRGPWGAALSATSVSIGSARMIWWRNLLNGQLIISPDLSFSISDLDRALQDPQVEECTLQPVLIRQLLRHHHAAGGLPAPRYPHLIKLMSIGGPASAVEKLGAYHQLSHRYVMLYSATETGVVTRQDGADLLSAPESCGKVLPHQKVDIIDNEGKPQPIGSVGRIRVTTTHFKDDPQSINWPGDQGWLDAEGFLYLAGRSEGIIHRHGKSFWARTLEYSLLQDIDLLDAAVLALPGSNPENRLVFAVRLAVGADWSQVLSRLLARLPAWQHPEKVMVVTSDDVTLGGKLLRSRLHARATETP